MNQLLPDTPDGFPEMGSQENIYWGEEDLSQSNREKLKHSSFRDGGEVDGDPRGLEESNCDPPPFHWDHPESYCDPPHEEGYDPLHEEVYGADPPHEWD